MAFRETEYPKWFFNVELLILELDHLLAFFFFRDMFLYAYICVLSNCRLLTVTVDQPCKRMFRFVCSPASRSIYLSAKD